MYSSPRLQYFQQNRRPFYIFFTWKRWEGIAHTSLSLFDEANLWFFPLKMLIANPIGVVQYLVGSPVGSCRFLGDLVGLQDNLLFSPYLPHGRMD